MKRIGPLIVVSFLSWPVALPAQSIQPSAARQFGLQRSHSNDGYRGRHKVHRVDCDRPPAGGLQKAIDATDPGDTLMVSGTCHEHVTVPVEKSSITLDGGGTAAISGSDPAQPTVLVRGRDATIQGFTITGGLVGIAYAGRWLGTHRWKRRHRRRGVRGLSRSALATAVIVNNTIQHNGQAGIAVAENGNAFVGFVDSGDLVASPNVVSDNGTQGIVVFRNSYARIVGNDISRNTVNGLLVREASHALVTDNVINSNGQSGIVVLQGFWRNPGCRW